MASTETSILVVDDAKFSSAIIAKALKSGGFSNVRFTNNPLQALRSLEKRSAQILIADWLMPSMDGLELTSKVKSLDAATEKFTYVILLTGRDDIDAMTSAFAQGVDDFLNKANLRAQLVPRVLAAERIANRQNELLQSNRLLRKRMRELQRSDTVDPVTGLGNQKFTLERIQAVTNDAEARGGAACLMLVGINNLPSIEEQHPQPVVDELMSGIGAKLRSLVRPLDIVARPNPNIFAVVMRHPSAENCNSQSFRRVFDNLYMHSFKTSAGFVPVVVGVSICSADASTTFPDANVFLETGKRILARSFETGIITAERYDSRVTLAQST